MTVSRQWDVVVLGSGPGGYVAAIRAAQRGLRTAVVEREHIGGVCLNWGCIPTKALIHSVSLYRSMKSARQYGIIVDGLRPDLSAMVAQSRAVSRRISKGVEYLLKKNGIEIIWGRGRLADERTVEVMDKDGARARHRTKGIILATGGSAETFPGLERMGPRAMTVREAMTPSLLPDRLLIIGAGAIGVEFAYIYACLGVKVTIVEMLDQLLPLADHDVAEELTKAFRRLRIEILVSTRLHALHAKEDSVEAILMKGSEEVRREADRVLVAIGVDPNSSGLGLEEIGVRTDRGFVVVDGKGHTGIGGIFAIGDLVGGPLLAHKASAEGMVAAETLAGMDVEGVDRSLIPSCCYSEPQVAQVGATERELMERGEQYITGYFPMAGNAKASAVGSRVGFVKLLFSGHNRLLGAHLVGRHVSELIAEVALCMREGITADRLGSLIHPHPSLSEAVMEAAEAAEKRAIHV